jgi:hypothetical protein
MVLAGSIGSFAVTAIDTCEAKDVRRELTATFGNRQQIIPWAVANDRADQMLRTSRMQTSVLGVRTSARP